MMTSFRSSLLVLFLSLFTVARVTAADSARFELTIDAGKQARQDVPVTVDITLPEALKDAQSATVELPGGKSVVAQVTRPRLLSKTAEPAQGEVARQLNFIVDSLPAGEELKATATVSGNPPTDSATFAWKDTAGKYMDLQYDGRNLLRYMYEPLDKSTKERREETMKVYHHVFDPASEKLLTKGPGGKFPHHRGLFFGFNKIVYDGKKKADVWHCRGKEFLNHEEVEVEELGPVLGRHTVKVGWHGQEGEKFAEEDREMTVYRPQTKDGKPVGMLIEFASILRTEDGPIKLNGDPQHSGFHFRAAAEVTEPEVAAKTYYIRPDGVGKPGDYRNWPKEKDQVNFPWKGMSFELGGQRYTVANLDRPENPKESRFSERDYGRFGSYFEYEVTKDQPLELNYRVWVQPGEMTVEEIDRMAKDFTEPVRVTAKRI
jgi:hypothetical protein